jgi:hypothetical protein
LVQITVEVNLERRRQVIGGAAGRLRHDACKTQLLKASTTRTGLSCPTKSSKHSGSSMSWARSWPSTKRFTLESPGHPPSKYQI